MQDAVETRYEHIVLSQDQVACIAGTNTKVVELIVEIRAYGWSPEELHFQHPYLSLGQIHSALAYYWDHQDAIDRDLERRLQHVDHMQQTAAPTRLEERLKAKGLMMK